jgi:PHD/YefM family antitoxin component YafN of YafNO toxin-antitoxin module
MNIATKAIVSNSEIIKNYKTCREKAEAQGKIFILRNNQPDAVLFSISEYEKISILVEYLETLDADEILKITESIPSEWDRRKYTIDVIRREIRGS